MTQSSELLPSLLSLAKQAGDAILAIYQAGSEVQYKQDHSPLTKADLASHHILVDGLARLTPDIPILSEEASEIPYETRSQWSRYWLIDPLDGTKEFISRNGEFTVNIALIDNKEPVLGVVYIPVKGEFYYASKGNGAFFTWGVPPPEATRIAVAEPKAGAMRVVMSRSHAGRETLDYLKTLEAKGFTIDAISVGSSLKLCWVADGKAHLYPRFGPTMEWDIAAAQCVVEEAGGVVLDMQRQRLIYNKPDMHSPYFIASCREDVM